MPLFFSFLISSFMAASSFAAGIDCHYQFMGMPFSQIQLGFSAAGDPEDFVTISVQGKSHRESFSPVPLAAGEMIHGWISQESAENSVEMIVFRERQNLGQSKIVNHHVPMGQEIWGNCQ